MNTKVYEKTRYQNIYRHKKNKNYLVMISKPVKTSISSIDGKKITKLEDAVNIRDNPKLKLQKQAEITFKEDLDTLWYKYIDWCKTINKQAYNTYHKKEIIYSTYIKGNFTKSLSKYKKDDYSRFIDKLDTTDNMKNHIIKHLKTFLNWCVEEEYLYYNPILSIKKYKIPKTEMKYWLPEHIAAILKVLNEDINSNDLNIKKKAYLIKMVIIIGFSLGDRIGETRALLFENISKEFNTIRIKHSINYNTHDENYLVATKTEKSDNILYVTSDLINDILNYKHFLKTELNYNVNCKTPILVNPETDKPFSDSNLRKHFNYYIEKANVPKIRMYDLRHTMATTLMSENYDMYDIQDRLRHKSIKTSIDKYGHVTLEKKKKVADTINKFLYNK